MRRVMPALLLIIFDDRHMVGEHAAEAGVREPPRALFGRNRLRRRLEGERDVAIVVDFSPIIVSPATDSGGS